MLAVVATVRAPDVSAVFNPRHPRNPSRDASLVVTDRASIVVRSFVSGPSGHNTMKRLVILSPNWLGDAVMALPAIADVRRAAPEASITIAARAAIAPLFQLVPEVDATIVLPKPAAIHDVARWRTLGAELAGGAFDAALLLPNSMHAALVVRSRRHPRALGLPHGLARPAADARDPALRAECTRWSRTSSWSGRSGFRTVRASRRSMFRRTRAMRRRGCWPTTGWDGRAPLVALAPGAAYGGAKRWPPAYFGELAAALAADGVRLRDGRQRRGQARRRLKWRERFSRRFRTRTSRRRGDCSTWSAAPICRRWPAC